jgi:hypothetical protein
MVRLPYADAGESRCLQPQRYSSRAGEKIKVFEHFRILHESAGSGSRHEGRSILPNNGITANFSVVDLYRMMRTKGFAEGLTWGLLDRSCMYGMCGSIPTQPTVTCQWYQSGIRIARCRVEGINLGE